MAFNLTPEALGLMSGGVNMLAASRGGNTDLTKGGIGYALQQGLQGGLQGLQMGKQMQQADQKQKMINDMLMKLNLDPSAQASTGVLQPEVQQNGFSQMTPQQKEVAKMAIMSGDWKSLNTMLAPDMFGSSGMKEFNALTANLTEEEKEVARRIKVGLDPRAVGSADQTITFLGNAGDIAKTRETLKAGEKRGEMKEELAFKPLIETAVTEARKNAEMRGDAFTELSQAKAALPGLTNVVSQLRDLSQVATSTLGGKAFDAVSKQLGFGGTEGATARAKFQAIIDNQVLPLLKPTFGAAFTVQEGESLKATLGNVDATPEEKMAQLDSFISQKMRDIETKQSLLNQGQGSGLQQLPAGITEDDITATMKANNMTRQQVLEKLNGR